MRVNALKKTTVAFAIFLVFILIFSLIITAGGITFAIDAPPSPDSVASLEIGQLSDIHYFPLEYCYQFPNDNNYKDSDFYYAITGDTKLVLESGAILNATIQKFIADAKVGTAPKVVIATGDLSKNGERVALIDVANALRYMQNEIRKVSGYENFQVFVVPGNHDLYNGSGELYYKNTGAGYRAEAVTAAQFAMIFTGLGYPDIELDSQNSNDYCLTDYFERDYWADYTHELGSADSFIQGYVSSKNASNFTISYYSDALQSQSYQDIALLSETDRCNNVLSYVVNFKNELSGYTLFMLDSSDREISDEPVYARISKQTFDNSYANKVPFAKNMFYKAVLSGSIGKYDYVKLETLEAVNTAYSANEKVCINTGYNHITGGRLTRKCLDWVESMLTDNNYAVASTDGVAEKTVIAAYHHNTLPHFTMEDKLLKDFTLYNWEYTAKELLKYGIRYTFTGHMHTNDTVSYTDSEGRTLTDTQTGSSVSYDSPRRYLTMARGILNGKLHETYKSEIHVLDSLKGVASSNISNAPDWNEEAYQTAKKQPGATFNSILAANKFYFTYTTHHDDFNNLSYNGFINREIYGQLVDRLLDHFLNEKLISGLVPSLINTMKTSSNSVLSLLGNSFGGTIEKLLNYIIDIVMGTSPSGGLYGTEGYPYEGARYDSALEYLRAVVDNILGSKNNNVTAKLRYGTEGHKINAGELISYAYLSHITGRELSISFTENPVKELYVQNSIDDPVYRTYLQAALQDLNNQLDNGKFVKDLLENLIDPLIRDEDSLIKTLLNYKFDFINNAGLTKVEKDTLTTVVSLLKELLPSLLNTGDTLNLNLDLGNLVLNDVLTQILPLLGGLIGSALGFTPAGDDIMSMVEGFLDDYLVDSFYVGIGGIVKEIVNSLAVDDSKDMENISNPSIPMYVSSYGGYNINGQTYTYISGKPAGPESQAANIEKGRLPSHVTANFDTKNSTSAVTIKFYTAEDIFATFRYKTSLNGDWTEVSTLGYGEKEIIAVFGDPTRPSLKPTADYLKTSVTEGNVTIVTQALPQYLPLIDLGLAAITHTSVDYENKDKKTVLYTGRDRDNAPANSVIYYNCHTVTVTGLAPGTTVYYDLDGNYTTSDGETVKYCLTETGNYDYYTVKTAPSKTTEDFEFLALSDLQGMVQGMYDESYVAMQAIMNNPETSGYEMILNGGDMTDNGNSFYHWGYMLNTYRDAFLNTSTFVAAGNHENGTDGIQNFYNYNVASKISHNSAGYYFSFDYANAHFIVLDTNDTGTWGLSTTQFNWLKRDLQANQNAKWTFVLMHKSLYSSGAHAKDVEVIAMRNSLVPLFNQYGVDVVLSGHDHSYTATHLIGKDLTSSSEIAASDGSLCKGSGTLYVAVGTAGTKYYNYEESDVVRPNVNVENSVMHTLDTQTFGYISVRGDVLTYTGYMYNKATDSLDVISDITIKSQRQIVIDAIVSDNAPLPSNIKVGFSDSSLSELGFDDTRVPYDLSIVYIADGREYSAASDIKLKGQKTSVQIALKDTSGNLHEVKLITIERHNFILYIVLISLGIAAVAAAAVTVPVVLKIKKNKGAAKTTVKRN